MVWARLEDTFTEHPKVVGLSDRAFRLHVTAIVYASRLKTDGLVPASMPRSWGFAKKHSDELVAERLWEVTPKGFQVHDFLEYNPSKVEIEEKSARLASVRSNAGKAGAAKRWQTDGKADGNGHGKSHGNTGMAPSPDDDDLTDSTFGARASSASSDLDRGHAFAMAFAILPWRQKAAARLETAGYLDDAELAGLASVERDYSPEQAESALERCESRNRLPFVRNLREELIAEFGEPDWVRPEPQRYG